MKVKHKERFPRWLEKDDPRLGFRGFSSFNLFKGMYYMEQTRLKYKYNHRLKRLGYHVTDDKLYERLRVHPTPLLMSQEMADKYFPDR